MPVSIVPDRYDVLVYVDRNLSGGARSERAASIESQTQVR